MNSIELSHAVLSGCIDIHAVAPSKSYLHRKIICSALAGQELPHATSEDTCATRECVTAILNGEKVCNARDSASTLRFLIPLALMHGGIRFILGESLKNRPLGEYDCIKGAIFSRCDSVLEAHGSIEHGDFVMQGNISSQFVSGLLFALPMLTGDSEIILKSELQSEDYVSMTISVLRRYGIEIRETERGFFIAGNQHYKKAEAMDVEGDLSYAANFVVANYLGADIDIIGINKNSLQPDRRIFDMLGKDVCDVSECPDIFPVLCVAACGKVGKTDIINAGRVRLKESDRISAMARELSALGADIREREDGVTIHGKGFLSGGRVWAHNDHRVAMALAIAALCICKDKVTIEGAECVKKSVPEFFKHVKGLIGEGTRRD